MLITGQRSILNENRRGRLFGVGAEPMGYVDGANLYQMELSNPVNGLDPTGLASNNGVTGYTRMTQQELEALMPSADATWLINGTGKYMRSIRAELKDQGLDPLTAKAKVVTLCDGSKFTVWDDGNKSVLSTELVHFAQTGVEQFFILPPSVPVQYGALYFRDVAAAKAYYQNANALNSMIMTTALEGLSLSMAAPAFTNGMTNTPYVGGVRSIQKATGRTPAVESNAEVRAWYNEQVKNIDTSGPRNRATAECVHSARNALKQQARDMMADRAAAEQLAKEQPLQPLQYYIDKYTAEGLQGESLWGRIIQGGTTPNQGTNTKYGVE